ncbi:MAG: AzlC family ABC transporter permease [Clostridiales bacterium]|nr:AzlC family ABC transporter permease [Clostridiales bacterium]
MKKTKATAKEEQLNFKVGLKDGLPIGLGYLSVSFAFGVQAVVLGVPWFMSLFISMTNLTSAGQLAGLTVIATLGTFLEMVVTQLVINSRYFLMSITLSQKMDDSFTLANRFFYSAFVTDEIFAVSSSKKGLFNKKYFLGLIILPYFGWSLGTLLGATAGSILPPMATNALNIALYAMFIAIIIPPSIKQKGVAAAVLMSAGISCILFFVPAFSVIKEGIRIIISAVITAVIMAFVCPINKEDKKDAVR